MVRLLFLAGLLAASASAQPSLNQLALSNGRFDGSAVFDLTDAAGVLHLRVAASSPGSEVEAISFLLSVDDHFGGTTTRALPTITDATAAADVALPRFLQTGTYRLTVGVIDADGRVIRWTPDELAGIGLPNQIEVRVEGDVYAPELAALDVENVADPFAPQGTVRATFYDPSGTLAYRVVVASPQGRRYTLAELQSAVGEGPGHTFTSAFSLPRRGDGPAEEGAWTVVEVRATDSNGTTSVLGTHDLTALGLRSRFWVGPVPPEGPPEVGCGWPNPVVAGRAVRVPASARVYDVQGRRVGQADPFGAFDTAGLGAGLYVARDDDADAPCRFTVAR